MLDLAGRGALIIGAKRVGMGLARRLAKEGVNLTIAYRRSKDEAERLRDSLSPPVKRVLLVQGDVSLEEDVQRILRRAREEMGGLSFVINLASSFPYTPFSSLDGRAWDVSIADARASYLVGVHAGRELARNPGPTRGHILFFSDWAAKETPFRGYLPYLTAKAAIDFMTRAFATELANQGVLVNAIAPGATMRPPDFDEEEWRRLIEERVPLRREASTEDMGEIVVALLKSETITGETIRVDSGSHLAGPGAAN
jgi:NAD(P)-dependent dehydrogenase (short-subunit alcohol dehydrogenase family)